MNTFRDFIPEGEEVPVSNIGPFRDWIPEIACTAGTMTGWAILETLG